MKLRLVLVGKNAPGPLTQALEEMLERVRRSAPVEVHVVPEITSGEVEHKRKVGTQRLMEAVKDDAMVVLLDERGKQFTSEGFAAQVGRWRDQGARTITFVVGGAYGVEEPLRRRAQLVLALSSMTFPHQLVRVFLAEQLYRAFSILDGRPYHH
ncbi:MAG: 23S rRNA (pseudouridine(1915)-N(3))-methyltransferase RlmH [Flavobacteriales bacterium]|nr:23S rRNA (pseudouridine(1915)-N(3))-methyltransferase RlmH [Flavobacteriales bacterium]MBK9538652.1 23S rRNA (pseudouridine(1915)-N(3))-methyltransferase RlmH [Flavobacteriales bacterium]